MNRRAAHNQLKPLASLAGAALIALFANLPMLESGASSYGLARALRIIQSVETVGQVLLEADGTTCLELSH
jgi:hypothetical protein